MVLAGGGQHLFLLGVPVDVHERARVLPKLGRSRESKLRLNVLIEVRLRRVVRASRVLESRNFETVTSLRKSVLWLIRQLRVDLSFTSQVYRVKVVARPGELLLSVQVMDEQVVLRAH